MGICVKLSEELFITTPLQDWIAHCFKALKSGLARELSPLEACGDDKFDLIARVINSVQSHICVTWTAETDEAGCLSVTK